jgi:hypothetical protein
VLQNDDGECGYVMDDAVSSNNADYVAEHNVASLDVRITEHEIRAVIQKAKKGKAVGLMVFQWSV